MMQGTDRSTMKFILVGYLLIYGLMHVYFYLRLRAAFFIPSTAGPVFVTFLALMVLAPVIVRLAERRGWEFFAHLFSYVGYSWMGFLFLFVTLSLACDLFRFLLSFSTFRIPAKLAFLIPAVISVLAYVYGYFEARDIRVTHLVITSPRIPESLSALRLVQVSDIHTGLIVRGERLRRMVEEVIKLKPDLLVSTGDLVDGQIDSLKEAVSLWQEVNTIYGKYAVTGNHEFFAGIDQALVFMEEAGFRVLRGEAVVPVLGLCLVGVDDPVGRYLGFDTKLEIPPRGEAFTILLKHQPFVSSRHRGKFDLQLSGHTHAGQLFPFSIITALYFGRQEGLHTLPDRSQLYINRGTGTWGPPVRIFAPPEITLVELKHSNPDGSGRF